MPKLLVTYGSGGHCVEIPNYEMAALCITDQKSTTYRALQMILLENYGSSRTGLEGLGTWPACPLKNLRWNRFKKKTECNSETIFETGLFTIK